MNWLIQLKLQICSTAFECAKFSASAALASDKYILQGDVIHLQTLVFFENLRSIQITVEQKYFD
jgi:hypothetical protein